MKYVNMIRTNPKSFIPIVKEYMECISKDGKALFPPGGFSGICLKEGKGAF